jgi:hypothetical protein
MNTLYCHNQTISQWSTGGAYFYPLHEVGHHKLIMGIECEFLAIQKKQIAMLDTGAELCVAGNDVYQLFLAEHGFLGDSIIGKRKINTRLGNFEGTLHRIEIVLAAIWGEDLLVEGTFLFCEEWEGPTVLGFHGFLERIRLAIDPDYENTGGIYFAST